MQKRRHLGAAVVAAGGVMVGLVAVQPIVSAMSDDTSMVTDKPTHTAVGKEMVVFPDVATMTATSDLVVRATVSQIRRGRTVGPEDAPITFREVSLDIGSVVYQRPGRAVPSSVVVEEEGWTAEGLGFTMNGVAWSRTGDTGYFFLHRKSDARDGTYRLAGSHGRALITGSSVALSGDNSHGEGPWDATGVRSRGAQGLDTEIRAAAGKARSGQARPLITR